MQRGKLAALRGFSGGLLPQSGLSGRTKGALAGKTGGDRSILAGNLLDSTKAPEFHNKIFTETSYDKRKITIAFRKSICYNGLHQRERHLSARKLHP